LELLQVNSDGAPTRIEYLDRSCAGRVIQSHDAPAHYLDNYSDVTWAKWQYSTKYPRSELLPDDNALLANTDYWYKICKILPGHFDP
jgi:hypothetical protein